MTNRKTTKRALLGSVLALILCFSMLLGSTYAWFTDTDYVAVNSIKSGTLDIELLDENNNSLVGKTLNFIDLDGEPDYADPADLLWEPGATYKLPVVRIKNAGNLALKYHLTVNGVVGDAKLLEVIDWTIDIDGTPIDLADGLKDQILLPGHITGDITVIAHMQEEAGNEYQNLTLSGIGITVLATQVPYENDSYGPDYDENAPYPAAPTLVNTFAELQYAIDNGQPAKLNADLIPETGSTETEVIIQAGQTAVIDLNGHKLGAAQQGQYINGNWNPIGGGSPISPKTHFAVENYGTLTLVGGGTAGDAIVSRGVMNRAGGTLIVEEGVSIQATDANGGASVNNYGDMIINNATLIAECTTVPGYDVNTAKDGPACVINNAGGNMEINGATLTSDSFTYAIVNRDGNMVINDVTINSTRGGISANGGNVVVNNATVNVTGGAQSGHAVYVSGGVITINGGTFLVDGVEDIWAASPEMLIDNR